MGVLRGRDIAAHHHKVGEVIDRRAAAWMDKLDRVARTYLASVREPKAREGFSVLIEGLGTYRELDKIRDYHLLEEMSAPLEEIREEGQAIVETAEAHLAGVGRTS